MKKIILFLGIICVLLAGCGKKDKQVHLLITTWEAGSEAVYMNAHVKKFEELHPNIKVDVEDSLPWNRMFSKLMITTAGHRSPDVTRVSSEWFIPLAAKHVLVPLDDLIKRDNFDIGDFYESALESCTYKGKLYCLPVALDAYGIYYNKKMFDDAGVPYPDGTWTYEDFVKAGEKIGGDYDGDGRQDHWGAAMWAWCTYVLAFDGALLTPDLSQCAITSDNSIEGLQFMVDLVHKYHTCPTNEDSANLDKFKLFTSGRAAMTAAGCWWGDTCSREAPTIDFDVAPMPRGPRGTRATTLASDSFAVTTQSKHKEEAWLLAQWMTEADYMREAIKGNQIIPARKSMASEFISLRRRPYNKQVFIDAFVDKNTKGWVMTKVVSSSEIMQVLGSASEKMRLNRKGETVKGIAEDAAELVNTILKTEQEAKKK